MSYKPEMRHTQILDALNVILLNFDGHLGRMDSVEDLSDCVSFHIPGSKLNSRSTRYISR